MSGAERRFFSGPSLEAALMRAARFHRVAPEKLNYRKLDKRHGFLRVRRGVVIEVNPAAPVRRVAQTEEVASPAVEGDIREPANQPEDREEDVVSIDEDTLAAAREGVERALRVAALDLECTVDRGDDQVEVELQGADQELLLAERGQLLLAIQHLLPRLIRGLTGRAVPCRVDCADFHRGRQERLQSLAERSAAEVRRRRQAWTLEPMAPDERRIIHLALADDADVVTESEGRGYFKRVTIRPAQARPRGFERYSR